MRTALEEKHEDDPAMMLPLDSPRWAELDNAYGEDEDIPALLRRLTVRSRSEGEEEPWFSIWSALAHQGDVHSASFAAVPHVIHLLSTDPIGADPAFFHFPTWVEICREKTSAEIPEDLQADYFSALARLPALVAAAAEREWADGFLAVALAAIAAAKKSPLVAEAALELTPEVAVDFLEWLLDQ